MMGKTNSTKRLPLAQVIAQHMQFWIAVKATDPDFQHEIIQLRTGCRTSSAGRGNPSFHRTTFILQSCFLPFNDPCRLPMPLRLLRHLNHSAFWFSKSMVGISPAIHSASRPRSRLGFHSLPSTEFSVFGRKRVGYCPGASIQSDCPM